MGDTYFSRKKAVALYLAGETTSSIKKQTEIGAKQAYRLIRERRLQPHPDGREYGWRGLVPYLQISPYRRKTKIRVDQFGQGAVGAMRALLDAEPLFCREFEERILRSPSAAQLGEIKRTRQNHTTWFLEQLRQRGYEHRHAWPFNTKTLGYNSICRFINETLEANPRAAARLEGGNDLVTKLSSGDGVDRPVKRFLQRVEMDAHKLDGRFSVALPLPEGGHKEQIINWSTGCLAKHESVESFAARFCELNKISVKQFYDYVSATIEHAWRPGWPLSDDQTAKLSAALQEPQAVVDSVLCPYSGAADPFAHYCGNWKHQDRIKYCPSCASEGYHSHFHTFYWLERCPFEGAELLTHASCVGRDGLTNRVEALAEILRAQWVGWPGGVPASTINRRHLSPLFMSFQRWMLDTNTVTRNLIEMKTVQRRNDHWVEEPNCANRVYQIRALLPPPAEIMACYSGAVPTTPNLLPLSAKVSAEVRELMNKFEFYELVWFFRVCRNSDPAGSVSRDALDSELEALRLNHAPCRCRWGHSRSEGWRRVHPDEWPHWDLKCPNEVACDVLEAHYGDFRCGQSPRAADKEFFRYIECVEKYSSAGLARHHGAPGDTLPEVLQQCAGIWQPWVEWVGPLGELFDALLEAGRASDLTWLRRWLEEIENGAAPHASPFIYPAVGLIKHGEKLAILAWNNAGRD